MNTKQVYDKILSNTDKINELQCQNDKLYNQLRVSKNYDKIEIYNRAINDAFNVAKNWSISAKIKELKK